MSGSQNTSKTKKKFKPPPQSWAAVRSNVNYVGCYPDYAYHNPEYEDLKNYYVPPPSSSRKKGSKRRKAWKPPERPDDPDLPPTRDYTKYFLDGPARIMPSLERLTRDLEDPTTLRLDLALRRCYNLAKSRNRRFFALQGGGLCMGSNNKNFMAWDRLDPSECRSCLKKCSKKGKPCGKTCTKKRRKCQKPIHATCAHDDVHQLAKGVKGGGYFTNSVFEIKDMDYDETILKAVAPLLPEEGGVDSYAKFKYTTPEPGSAMSCPNYPNNFFPLSPAQLFAQQYFTIDNPIEGLLVDQSAGSGKTCLALNVVGNFMGHWKIVWVTRNSLRATPLKNLYRDICQLKLREIIQNPEPITLASGEIVASTPSEKIAFIRSPRGPAVMKRYGIEIEKQRIITYDDFVNMINGRNAQARKLRDQQLDRDPNHRDMGYQTLFVFDEAHNLVTLGLDAEERVAMDRQMDYIDVAGTKYRTTKDVYGKLRGVPQRKLVGRDSIPAMLWQSYRKSGKNAAKVLLLTATPMSQSPTELFWLLNLLLKNPEMRLSLDVKDYYDPATMKLRDEALIKFAAAAHGRISYFNTTKNPTQFAKKVFFDRITGTLHRFHEKIIVEQLEKHAKKTKKSQRDTATTVALYRNLGLAARVRAPFFTDQAIDEFEAQVDSLEDWNPEAEREKQIAQYRRDVEEARATFGLQIRATDLKKYAKNKKLFKVWAEKHHDFLRLPDEPPREVQDALDEQGDLLSLEEWVERGQREAEQLKEEDIPIQVQTMYQKLLQRKHDYEAKMRDFDAGRRKRKPSKPRLEDLLEPETGAPKTLTRFLLGREEGYRWTKRDVHRYEKLSRSYGKFRSQLRSAEDHASQSSQGRARFPSRSQGVDEVMDDQGQLRSLEDWWRHHVQSKRGRKPKKKYTKKELTYLKYVIRDPGTGKMRLRTLEEFLDLKPPQPSLDGVETRKNVSFLMWYKNYNSATFRKLMPYYCPKIHECIENIVGIEQQAQETYGHGFKHQVFTFSVAGKGAAFSSYGARVVASAFHARSDLFKVLLVYKADKNGHFVLRHDLPKTDPKDKRWGVAVLSSKPMPNVYYHKHGGLQTVDYNAKVVRATQAAFNDVQNRYGDQIKVIIMDGAYTEGVEAYDDNIAHMLDRGLSRSQLEQASARPVRFCRSKHIPFFKGVGGFLEMYFYALQAMDQEADLYHQMMSKVPYDEQVQLNLIDVFQDLAAQFSLDYWLNFNINEYNPTFRGEIVDYYTKYDRSYVISKPLEWSNREEKEEKTMDMEFIVDPSSVPSVHGPQGKLRTGAHVTDEDGVPATVVGYDRETQLYTIQYSKGIEPVRSSRNSRTSRIQNQVIEAEVSGDDLRLAPGELVDFHIPYGVDLAQKVMDIGNYNTLHPSDLEHDFVRDLKIPDNALRAIYTAFRNNVRFALIGFVSMLRQVIALGGAGVPVHITLPEVDDYDVMPAMSNFTVVWLCQENGARKLQYHDTLMKHFLSPKKGLSFMLLHLSETRCDENTEGYGSETPHSNMLLYVPEWGTVERFDPLGYSAHRHDAVALDARLYDLFQTIDPQLKYMTAAETQPIVGLQRLQANEKKRHQMDPSSFSLAFSLFYMQLRVMHASQALRAYPNQKRVVYPVQFQRGLIKAMQVNYGNRTEGELTIFIRDYAEAAVQSQDFVKKWIRYDQDLPFWANSVRLIRELQLLVAKKWSVKASKDRNIPLDQNIYKINNKIRHQASRQVNHQVTAFQKRLINLIGKLW